MKQQDLFAAPGPSHSDPQIKLPKPTKVFLEGGTSDTDHQFLDIAPTMRSITHKGRKYFKCPQSQAQDATDGEWGMMYLWDGWGDWKMAQIKQREASGEPA